MTKILIINGPNLNLLGSREKKFYGNTTIEKIKSLCEDQCKNYGMECVFFQSNHEGELIEKIQSVDKDFAGIIINPAAYTHTSIALLDALRATSKPKIARKNDMLEMHISKRTSVKVRNQVFEKFYRKELEEIIPTLVKKWKKYLTQDL